MTKPRLGLPAAAGAAFLLLFTLDARADGFTDPASMEGAIKGTMAIDFQTRVDLDDTGDVPEGSPALGAADRYTADLEVMNSVLLRGTIERMPWLPSSVLGRTIQEGGLDYDLQWVLRNPSNPAQTVTLGGWIGGVTLDGDGLYTLAQPPEGKGRLRVATDSVGNIAGFVSEFGGEIQGRAPEGAGLLGFADRASRQVNRTYARYVDGRVVEHTVEGADPMGFDDVVLAQGPLAGYPETRLNGSVDYDAEEGIWYVDLKAGYSLQGAAQEDRFSGTIRWNEDPNRDKNGLGWYEVNVRVNEQAVTEADAFQGDAGGASAEEAFFSTDVSVPGFTGRIGYVDKFDDDTVVSSQITYDVDAAQVSKIQAMTLAKVLMLMVGPFNDE